MVRMVRPLLVETDALFDFLKHGPTLELECGHRVSWMTKVYCRDRERTFVDCLRCERQEYIAS